MKEKSAGNRTLIGNKGAEKVVHNSKKQANVLFSSSDM
jgi:hypothetical protein